VLPFNGEAFVARPIESVLAQNYAAFELIVVETITDRTPEIPALCGTSESLQLSRQRKLLPL